MKSAALLIALAASTLLAQTGVPVSRLDLPLEQRLDIPQRIESAPLRLTDFVSFIAISFKVPLLVETPAPVRMWKHPTAPIAHGSCWTWQCINFPNSSGRTKVEWRTSTTSDSCALQAIFSTSASIGLRFRLMWASSCTPALVRQFRGTTVGEERTRVSNFPNST